MQKQQPNSVLKYSALGMQMGLTIAVFAFLGNWLDKYFEMEKPIITLVFLLIGTCGSLYSLIRKISS